MLGTLLAFASAAFFGMNAVSVRRGVLTGTVLQGMVISLGIGLPFFIIISVAVGSWNQIWQFSTQNYFLLAVAGTVHFAFGRYCNIRATQAMGGLLVRPLQQLSVILSLTLAIIFLDETLTPIRFFGIFLVLLGPIIMLRDRKTFSNRMEKQNRTEAITRIKFIPNYAEGIFFGICSAFGFGASPVFVRAAIGSLDSTTGIAGVVISYSAAVCIILLILLNPAKLRSVLDISKTSLRWFSMSAILIGISQMLRYTALTIAPVTVVTPIQQTTVVFQVIFSWFINRNHEAFGRWVLLGMSSSVMGAIAVSLSTQFILDQFMLPEFLMKIIGWSWP